MHGFIFGSVGSRIELRDCPRVQLHFAFIGEEPADYRGLAQLAERREQVLGFNALADGYVVDDRHPSDDHGSGTAESYVVLLVGLEDLREDPTVAASDPRSLHSLPQ